MIQECHILAYLICIVNKEKQKMKNKYSKIEPIETDK